MTAAKLIVMYPRPASHETFEKAYSEEHVPLAIRKLNGKTKSSLREFCPRLRASHSFTGLWRCIFRPCSKTDSMR